MNFYELKNCIKNLSHEYKFQAASQILQDKIYSIDKNDLIDIINEVGSIPEDIMHDSTEEKLYAKVTDIILAKSFMELGLKAEIIKKRSNCADVEAKSVYHNYSLVADAKAFRLSRTAKNQKDFKVESMVHWKCDSDYSVLCCPYFQYPKKNSQIYSSALSGNVSLFSWEYLSLLLQNDIIETETKSLAQLWNYSSVLAKTTTVENMDLCFLGQQNNYIKNILNITNEEFENSFTCFKKLLIDRGKTEIEYWENQIVQINQYSKEEAIEMLINSLKLKEKIRSINNYINLLRGKNVE